MVRLPLTNASNDEDLAKRIAIAFATRPRIAWHDIQVQVVDGIVTLQGVLPTSYDRRLVIAVTRHVAGVFDIVDNLDIEVAREIAEQPVALLRSDRRRSTWDLSRHGNRNGRLFLRSGFAAFAAAMLFFSGCGGSDTNRVAVHPASGALAFRGQPATGAFVSLHRKDSDSAGAPSPRATVGPDGTFTLSTYDGADGAPEGEYVLTVQWYRPVKLGNDVVGGPNIIPAKYGNAKTSDLAIHIAAGENQLKPIQLR